MKKNKKKKSSLWNLYGALIVSGSAKDPDARGRGEPSSSHLLLPENQIRRETGRLGNKNSDAQNVVLDPGISRNARRCSKHPGISYLQPFRSAWQHVALPSHAWTVTRTATIKARPARPNYGSLRL